MPIAQSLVQKRLYGSVTVYSLHRAEALRRLRQASLALCAKHPEIEEVRLVGSLARGEAGPGSDADVLILLNASALPFHQRIGVLLADWPAMGFGVDLLPFTRSEFEDRLRTQDPFICRLAAESSRLA